MLIEVPENQVLSAGRRIVAYTRVSTREQAENGNALEQHIERLKRAGATEIYFDVASRSKNDRVGLEKILDLIKNQECDEAIFIRLDRMTDSHAVLEKAITACLESGISIRGLDDNIDFNTTGGRLHARLLVSFSRAEVERLSERVRHGWAHLRDRKVAMNPPFGYCKVDNRFELDHAEFLCLLDKRVTLSKAEIASDIVQAYLREGTIRLALRAINEKYGISTFAYNNTPGKAKGGRVTRNLFRFSTSGLSSWLDNPVLRGHTRYLPNRKTGDREQIYYDTHPEHVLLDADAYAQVQALKQKNARVKGYGSTALKYPCSGLVFCAECRSACYSLKGNRGRTPGYNYYFQCKNWRTRACTQKKLIKMPEVEEAVIQALIDRAKQMATKASKSQKQPKPKKLIDLERQLQGVISTLTHGPNAYLEKAREDLERQIYEQKQSLESGTKTDSKLIEILSRTSKTKSFWATANTDQKKRIFQALVSRVVVRNGAVELVELNI